jgi:hypothetical protein
LCPKKLPSEVHDLTELGSNMSFKVLSLNKSP